MKFKASLILAVLAMVLSVPAHALEGKEYYTCAADDAGPRLAPFLIVSIKYTEAEIKEMDPDGELPESFKIKPGVETFMLYFMPENLEPQPMLANKVERRKGGEFRYAVELGKDIGYVRVSVKGKKTVVDINFKEEINHINNTNGPTSRYTCTGPVQPELRSGS